ncbi:YbjN domain-containing protein [Nocardia sp. alder85J]|uniref:YbjN domain-containing protein n=1 Tax=Nocardia sp. alder85J TaxID=2862949 RepID=UPI001CD5C787|nr:YbjN domain-containing protein [Nocardia sp. alder85J]MCX4098803.1 YbjN domain-containing protein [Nocardia sp. alder85J]
MTVAETAQLVEDVLRDHEIEYTRENPETFVAILPGERKFRTPVMLTVSAHGVRFESFVCRKPEENADGVHSFMLRRNAKLYGVAYALDQVGDIYLVGRIATSAVSAEELDRILGQILQATDDDFNTLLELGFAGAIRREWDWRVSRGESLHNLRAFEHLVDDAAPAPADSE